MFEVEQDNDDGGDGAPGWNKQKTAEKNNQKGGEEIHVWVVTLDSKMSE